MALKRTDNVGIVVENLAEPIDFFRELGLELEGQATVEGEWAGRDAMTTARRSLMRARRGRWLAGTRSRSIDVATRRSSARRIGEER